MIISPIASRYAAALFGLVAERNELESVLPDMQRIEELSQTHREFRNMLKSPVISTYKKQAILKDIFEKHVSRVTLIYLLVITRKRREKYIDQIAAGFVELYKEFRGILTTRLRSAAPVSEEIRKEILEMMKERTGKEIELAESVEEELIGGFILQWKDMQLDASILNQVNRLKRGVARVNLYVKGF